MRLALIPSRATLGPRGAATLVALVVATPIVTVVARVGADSGGLWSHLASTVLPNYLRNTLLLAGGVSLLTLLLGVGCAWLVTLCEFPGHRILRWALLLPLAAPTYLNAYALTDLLQFSGPVQSGLRDLFGWQAGDYWFPEIRSLGGAIVVLAVGLYPYIYLAARSAFLEQSVCVLEVGRMLGLGPWQRFLRIALPLARPSIVAGLALVLMETLAEFGAVQYFAVDTFATGIYRTFLLPSPGALTAAAQLSACLLLLVLLLLVLEARARRQARFHHTTLRHRPLRPQRLRGPAAASALAVCLLPVLVGFVAPLLIYAAGALGAGDRRARELFLELAGNTVLLATLASLLAVLLAVVVAFAQRLDPGRWSRACARIAGVGYAIPGGVIAIGILVVVTWLDRGVIDLAERLFGTTPGLLFTGTIVATVYGYQTRFLAVSLGFVEAGLSRIRPSLDGAARTLGARPLQLLRRVHLPLLRGSLGAAALLVFVDVVKELPATLIMRPFGFDTLAVRVYQLASDERLSEASSGALAILLVGLLPVLLLSRVLEHARPGSTTGEAAGPAPETVEALAAGASRAGAPVPPESAR